MLLKSMLSNYLFDFNIFQDYKDDYNYGFCSVLLLYYFSDFGEKETERSK